ncbi:MAG: 50S ribosomal protein L23 [Armatimonadetes bacterium]|nr:50S ribosomal protein L23 [Armatimonadota bacterium]
MKSPYTIIERPVVTEKSMDLSQKGKYVFRVSRDANKIEIREAIQTIYPNVQVTKVNTMTVHGKRKRMGRSKEGMTPSWKKAIITLAPGQKIELFEGL